jgi:hypothetical protein
MFLVAEMDGPTGPGLRFVIMPVHGNQGSVMNDT